jgi:hypothetical protein
MIIHYVHILKIIAAPEHVYVGMTSDLERHLADRNAAVPRALRKCPALANCLAKA